MNRFLHLLFGIWLAGSGCGGMTEPAETSDDRLSFSDATSEAGLGDFRHVTGAFGKKWFPETMGSGAAVIDYDGDAWPDILLAGGGAWADRPVRSLWLYRNNRDGTLVQVTEAAGLADVDAYSLGFAVADYDNDGDEDFYLTTLGRNKLFRNDDGVFTDVAEAAGAAGGAEWSTASIFFDADRDGDVDLYVGNYVEWSPESDIFCSLDGITKVYCTPETYEELGGRFFRNNGDGTFSEASEEAGIRPAPGKTLGVAEFDFDRDGFPDLVVANDTRRDLLYANDGDGTFTERGTVSGIAFDENGRPRAGMGVATGIVDDTGEPTVFVGNFSKEMIGVYRHIGNGLFLDRAAVSQIGRASLLRLTFGLFLFDVDLDGDLDLFAANGHIQAEIESTLEGIDFEQAPHLFLNRGDGTFEDAVPAIGGALAEPIVARGALYLDYDRDGDLDILATTNGGPALLWRNELLDGSSTHRFVRVSLEGRVGNPSGLSSRIVAVVEGRRMERRIQSGSSYLSQSELPATFGLGTAEQVDTLIVEWSAGPAETFTNLASGHEYRIVEGSGRLEAVEYRAVPASAAQ